MTSLSSLRLLAEDFGQTPPMMVGSAPMPNFGSAAGRGAFRASGMNPLASRMTRQKTQQVTKKHPNFSARPNKVVSAPTPNAVLGHAGQPGTSKSPMFAGLHAAAPGMGGGASQRGIGGTGRARNPMSGVPKPPKPMGAGTMAAPKSGGMPRESTMLRGGLSEKCWIPAAGHHHHWKQSRKHSSMVHCGSCGSSMPKYLSRVDKAHKPIKTEATVLRSLFEAVAGMDDRQRRAMFAHIRQAGGGGLMKSKAVKQQMAMSGQKQAFGKAMVLGGIKAKQKAAIGAGTPHNLLKTKGFSYIGRIGSNARVETGFPGTKMGSQRNHDGYVKDIGHDQHGSHRHVVTVSPTGAFTLTHSTIHPYKATGTKPDTVRPLARGKGTGELSAALKKHSS